MFDWFRARPRCPVADETRAWLDQRWAWLESQFGRDRVRNAQLIRPTPEFFPDPFDASPDAVQTLFVRVCEYMGVDPFRVRLQFYDERRAAAQGWSQGTAGLYEQAAHHFIVWIEVGNLHDPLALVATMAHELAHVHLLGHGRVSPDEADHEPLTDLLTVFLGLGVLTANSVIREASWSQGPLAHYSIGRQGYLLMPDFGYALAKFARARDEDGREWERELRLDVRTAFRQAMRFLDAESAGELLNGGD